MFGILQWCEMQSITPNLAISEVLHFKGAAILSEYETPTGMSFSTCKNTTSIELYWKLKTNLPFRKKMFFLTLDMIDFNFQ